MKVSGLPRARYDECFSSWLYRTQVKKKIFPAYELCASAIDPDLELSDDLLSCLCDDNAKYRNMFYSFFRFSSLWLLPWSERIAFCPSCLREDVAQGGVPYWRKSWCMLHAPVCATHFQLLSLYRNSRIEPDKAWMAFSADSEQPQLRVTSKNRIFPSVYLNTPRLMLRLALKVQHLLSVALNNSKIWFQPLAQWISTDWLLIFVNFLFEQFLFPRARNQGPEGIARGHQYRLPREYFQSFAEAKRAACEESDPYARVVSLILIGRVLGLVNDAEIRRVRDSMNLIATLFGCTSKDIAGQGIVASTKSDRWAIEQVLYQAPPAFLRLIEDFTSSLKWNGLPLSMLSTMGRMESAKSK